jgi:hypothetical protein
MKVPYKTTVDLIAVWVITGVANIIGFATNIFEYLPIIQHILAIISLTLAIGYTLYKFFSEWKGFNPRKKRGLDKRQHR